MVTVAGTPGDEPGEVVLGPRADREGRLVELEEQPFGRRAELRADQGRDGGRRKRRALVGDRRELGAHAPWQQIDARREISAEAGEDGTEIGQRLTQPRPRGPRLRRDAPRAAATGGRTPAGRAPRSAASTCLPPGLPVDGGVARRRGRGCRSNAAR